VNDHTINFNPYFPLLHSWEPFTYASLFVTKGITEQISLTGGIDVREADSIRDPAVAYTNRDFLRYTVGVEYSPIKFWTLGVNAEFWDVNNGDEFTGISGEMEFEPVK